ncbi:zinc metalloprotease [Limosilactobacillus reuteri]|uniref:hypothetical protein n=1 Tax=Limosilactobacillus reuteri TaxID=1598 RepID=UPI00081C1F9E|nr:hypothetical protein [Limosilactobacillus reuteri]MCH5379282.1 hypothetical protein [Limosilactobacillus reuteri]OCW64073.1 hypothetical protein BBP10_05505 [Limosilactobacillus reuteri]OCW65307.1 hypothetical protein BBP11_05570 [Limosilactobacillus reuteri]OCW67068.1 hypothetical protein BBP12_02215 [Limosilactobacillus reuteri]OCW68277.1 hypothetical protein BBP13_07805 [Limosilactobacillus reuteri]
MKKLEYKGLQLVTKDHKSWLYNPLNDRMITTSQPLEPYLKTINNQDNPLHDFYISKKQKSLLNIHLISLTLDSNNAKPIKRTILFLLNKYIVWLFFLLALFFTTLISKKFTSLDRHLSLYEIINLYIVFCLIIIPLHEYSHFVIYDRYFNFSKIKFGFGLRYLSLLVFFTKVPFYKLLTPSQKKATALAGIKMQIIIWSILATLYFIHPSHFLFILITTNIGMLLLNATPFLKLDGYWFLSNLLHTTDYMEDFIKMVQGKLPKRPIILFIGFINICCIAFSFLWSLVKLISLL